MAIILLVEDDETISFALKTALTKEGYTCITAETLKAAKDALCQTVDLILLDLGLPDGEGLEFCQTLKRLEAGKQGPPIMILTARDEEQDIIKGLDLGADDYVTKPFRLGILLSRIGAVLRRSRGVQSTEAVLCTQNICLNQDRTCVTVEGEPILLTAGEYRLLVFFLKNKNKTLTRSVLLEQIWDVDGEFVNDNTLTVTIKRLREKLGGDPQRVIKTVRGIGYRCE